MARNPIVFNNGTLISNAKVEIGGTIYDVDPAVYEGTTPLSASNLNQMQTNLYDYVDEEIENTKDVYSTTETKTNKVWIDNKPIYRKVIDFGALPNNNVTTVNHNIANIDEITFQYAKANDSSGTTYVIPHVNADNMASGVRMAMRCNKEWVQIYCNGNMSSFTGKFILEYTKTTD